MPENKYDVFLRGLAFPAVLVLAWILVRQFGLIDPRLLVPVQRVIAVPFFDPDGRTIWLSLVTSLVRMVAGFLIGGGLGILIGFVIGASSLANRLIGPSFTAVRQITVFAWIPLLTAWFGNSDGAKLVFIALSAFFPAALNTQQGLRDVPIALIETSHVMRLSWRTHLFRLLLPSALPSIAIGIEIALISAWIGTVGAEYAMGFGRGIGIFLAEGREQFRMDIVLIGVVTLALVGYGMNIVLRCGLRRLVPWQRQNS